MSTAVEQFLKSFDGLPDQDKHQAAVEILRRVSIAANGELPDTALLEAADALFQGLDADEARNREAAHKLRQSQQ